MANIPCSWRDGSRGAQFSIPNANVSLSLDMHLYLIDSDESWHLVATFQMPSAIHIGMFLQAWTDGCFDLINLNPQMIQLLDSIPPAHTPLS